MITISTSIESIKVQISDNGNYRLIDTERNLCGEFVSYHGIAQLEMPPSLQLDYGKDARYIWCSEFWEGCFPTEQLMVMSIVE